MSCDKYLELLALRLDGGLSAEEDRELEEHLSRCPDCRAAGAQLAALQEAFPELEDMEAPEGFAQGVMERIRAEASPKVIPLFKRPQFKALAGLAACLVLVVGLYGVSRRQEQDKWMLTTRSFNRDVVEEYADISAQESLGRAGDAPQIAAYSDSDTPVGDAAYGEQKSDPNADYGRASAIQATPMILTLDRMPEGGWELIPPETPVSPVGVLVTAELFEEIEQLAAEQGITASVTTGREEPEEFVIVVLEEIK